MPFSSNSVILYPRVPASEIRRGHRNPMIGGSLRCVSACPSASTWLEQTLHSNFASSAESVGRFWFRESRQVVIQGDFHSIIGAKAVGSSGNHSNFVVEAFDGAIGDFLFGPKPVQDERLMCA